MIQGTSSNAGKSLLVTALCRIFTRAGLSVAPFKAQNMSLNSSVTADGGEIGRAQALQAEACGLEADVRMNPVLLKPLGDRGSQLIVLGKVKGSLQSRDFLCRKEDLWKAVREAYESLAYGKDLMILEGAGSPAEINLRKYDIVNMHMARYAGARVLLTADIDRGGAFAALLGTYQLLTAGDRQTIAGFLLNKFRGDPSLLTVALSHLTRLTRRPFLGIVPWIDGLRLPDEDSVAFRQPNAEDALMAILTHEKKIDIVVLDLPHISNTTDLDALSCEPDVLIRRVCHPEDFGTPACVVLPGSRNTAQDLLTLRARGLDTVLCDYAQHCLKNGRGLLVGICAGFQMMGRLLTDPYGLEKKGVTRGLGLFPLETQLTLRKTVQRTRGRTTKVMWQDALPVEGYEIHHGESRVLDPALSTVLQAQDGSPLGYGLCDTSKVIRLIGTYLHGLFDSDPFRHALLTLLRREANLPEVPCTQYTRGAELNRLADAVEKSVCIPKLLRLIRGKEQVRGERTSQVLFRCSQVF